VNIKTIDRGYDDFIKRLTNRPRAVTVGVHAQEGAAAKEGDDGGITVAEVAAIHEFGLGSVPQRSWLRDFVDENADKLRKMLAASMREAAAGKLTHEEAMNRFGLAVVGMIKKRIVAGIEPELKPATKAAKERITGGPKDTPLILYGQLLSSIVHRLRESRT